MPWLGMSSTRCAGARAVAKATRTGVISCKRRSATMQNKDKAEKNTTLDSAE